jgi:hypothetical protein
VSISERSPSVSSGRVTRTETLWGFIQSEEQQSTSKNADCDIDHLAECSLSATIGEIGLLHRYDEIMPLGIWMCLSPIIQNYQNGHSGGETHGFGIEHFKKGPYMSVHIYIYIVSLCGAWLCPCPVGTRRQSRPKGRLRFVQRAGPHRRDPPRINDTRKTYPVHASHCAWAARSWSR